MAAPWSPGLALAGTEMVKGTSTRPGPVLVRGGTVAVSTLPRQPDPGAGILRGVGLQSDRDPAVVGVAEVGGEHRQLQ